MSLGAVTNAPEPSPGEHPVPLAVTRLSLTDFRNYSGMTLRTGAAPVVLTGPNGAGKTNILEAISLLAPGRGLRGARFAECERSDGPGGWAVAAEVNGAQGPMRLGTGLIAGMQRDAAARRCRIDGQPVRGPGAFADHLRVSWLTPAMDRLFAGPPGDRRRFFDRLVATIDPVHNRHLSEYERAMKERSRLLVDGRAEPGWLSGLEQVMAAAGVAVAAARNDAAARLGETIDAAVAGTTFPPARAAVSGDLETALAERPATEVEDRFRSTLAAGRPRDAAAGRALDGPHRSDLVVHHGQTGAPAERCSTGEQKALLIALVLAEACMVADRFHGLAPVLLLDEIAAHLDAERRAALFRTIETLGAQAWMTGTDRPLFSSLDGRARFFAVGQGEVQEVS